MTKSKNLSLILASLALSANALSAQIGSIEVKNTKVLDEKEIISSLPITQGTEFTEETEKELKNIFMNTGLFKDVEIKQNKKDGKVNLEIKVTEVENVQEVLEYNKKIAALSQRTDLVVNSLSINGNTNIDLSQIVENTNLKKGNFFVPINVTEISTQIFNTGYFREVIPVVNRDAKDKSVDVIINVKENPVIKKVNLEGITLFNEKEAKEASGLIEGKVFNAHILNPETSPILQAYQKNGIITARIEFAEVTDDGIVNIKISEGVVSSVEFKKKVALQNNKRLTKNKTELKTKPYVFERMNYVKVGNILTEATLTKTMEEIFRTGLFDSVEPLIEADENNLNGRKVTFLVSERPTTSINGNVSYETKEGLTGGITFADKNLLGQNKDVAIQVSFGTKGNYEINASYFDPWLVNTDRLQLGASVFLKREKARRSDLLKYDKYKFIGEKTTQEEVPYQVLNVLRDSGSYIYGGSLTLGKGIRNNTFITVKPRIYGVKTNNAEYIRKDKSEEKNTVQAIIDYTLGSATLGVTYDTRNDIAIPKKGLYLSSTYELGYIFREKSLTSTSLSQLHKDVKDYYTTLMADATVKQKFEDYKTKKANKATTTEDLKTAKEAYENAVEEYVKKNKVPSLAEPKDASKPYNKDTLKPRPYHIFNLDARAYHEVIKDKNSMAYRLTLGYASKGTPENMLFSTYNGGTTLRGYNDERASILATATVENRTYINNYVQLVVFAEAGINNKKTDQFYNDGKYVGLPVYQGIKDTFTKANMKADIGIGTRLTTPLGVIRLDYSWPLMNTEEQSKKGKFSFGFGQTF